MFSILKTAALTTMAVTATLPAVYAQDNAQPFWGIEVEITGFSGSNCQGKMVGSPETMDNQHHACVEWDDKSPRSYIYQYEDGRDKKHDKQSQCVVRVYSGPGCSGTSSSLGAVKNTKHVCGTPSFPIKSAHLDCGVDPDDSN